MSKAPLIVDCPTCKSKVTWVPSNIHRPFCSERCQQIDLGAWANEEYNIPAPLQEEWSENHSINETSTLQ